MANPVCYGDTIFLESEDFYLSTNGFYDPVLYLTSTEKIALKSFRNGLFKIYPNLSYKDTTQVDDLKHQLDLLKSLNIEETYAADELEDDLNVETKNLEARESRLEELNNKMIGESKGQPIKYGQKIQLLHVESNSFVVATKTLNKEDKTLMNLELVPRNKASKASYFMFMPKLVFSQEGEVVDYSNPMKLISCKFDTCFVKGPEVLLDTIRTELNPETSKITNNNEDFPVINPRRKEPLYQAPKVFCTGTKLIDVPENTYVRKFVSFQDEQKAKVKKALRNGDYVRISNEKLFLYIIQNRSSCACFFQACNNQYDYAYNKVLTLFQLIELNFDQQESSAVEGDKSNAKKFPQGHLLKYDPNKRYLLRHVESGLYVMCKDGVIGLAEYDEAKPESQKLSIIISNKSKKEGDENYIDRNAILKLKFHTSSNEELGILTSALPIKIPNTQLETNTYYYYGFIRPENYLNKWLRPERYSNAIKKVVDDQFSSYRLLVPSSQEIVSTFLVESLANHLQRFNDYLDDFLQEKNKEVKQFNQEIKKLSDISEQFHSHLFEDEYNEASEDILAVDNTRQTLLREFRVYDLIYRVFFYLAINEDITAKYNKIREAVPTPAPAKVEETTVPGNPQENPPTASQENPPTASPQENREPVKVEETVTARSETEKVKEVDVKVEINFDEILKLFHFLQKIIVISFKKNDLNRYYCSQFIRIPINCVLSPGESLFKYATEQQLFAMRDMMLILCKKGLWDKDLDALGQLNFYESPLFDECIEPQKTFHPVFIRLIEHFASSKAPNLQCLIRDNFVFNFLSKSANVAHVFPKLLQEDGSLCIQFKRKKHPDENYLLNLNDVAYQKKGLTDKEKAHHKFLLNYFLKSINLILAISSVQSSMLELKFIRYYPIEDLTKAINLLKGVYEYHDLNAALLELINKVHLNYFSVVFTKLPNQIQILDKTPTLVAAGSEIQNMIEKATSTNMSQAEADYIKDEELTDVVNSVKAQVSSENQNNTILRILDSSPKLDDIDTAITLLEDMKEILLANPEISFQFLKKSRDLIYSLLDEVIKKPQKMYWDFIKQALDVCNILEAKTVTYAATDIVAGLKHHNLFGGSSLDSSPKKRNHKESGNGFDVSLDSPKRELLKKERVKIAPVSPIQEQFAKSGINLSILPTVIETYIKQWKTGERFLVDPTGDLSQITKAKPITHSKFKETNVTQNMSQLLEILLLGQDFLLSDVIQRLKNMSSFESELYQELNKLAILHDDESVAKTIEVIKITLRLNQISREVFFCKDNLIAIEENRLIGLLEEVNECQWKLFFIIYDCARHFRFLEANEDPQKAFRTAFEAEKNIRWDSCFRLKPEAINTSYQKIYMILSTYEVLIKTQHWVLDKKSGFDEKFKIHNFIVRLNVVLSIAIVTNNKNNQMLLSKSKGIIRQFYNQHFINQTPDTLQIFAEIMKDNKRLLRLPIKYLYDITMSTFVGTMARSIRNSETNNYLAVGILSLAYISRASIPLELYNPISDLKSKWSEANKVEDFTSLKVNGESDEIFKPPFCYQSIQALLEITLRIAEDFSSEKQFSDIQLFLGFAGWMKFFQDENYVMQFELKGLLVRCMNKIYYEHETKNKLIQESEDALQLVAILAAEIIFYRNHKTNKDSPTLSALVDIDAENFVTKNEKFKTIKTLQKTIAELDLKARKIKLNLEDVPFDVLLTEYIYNGCLDLLFSVVLKEVDYIKETRDVNSNISSLMDYVLVLIEEFIAGEHRNPGFPFQKFEDFLSRASVAISYSKYKLKLVKLANQVYRYAKAQKSYSKRDSNALKQEIRPRNPIEVYQKHIAHLLSSKKVYKDQNIKQVADCIADHPKNKQIIKQIIKYLKKDSSKLDHEEIIFILKLLRKYIERENTNNSDENPIYLWNEINLGDLKKIANVQQTYRFEGLSNLLFMFFGNNDKKIFREALLLALAYMYGGNIDVQKDFYMNLKDDDDNKIILQLKDMLQYSWEAFRATETKRTQYLYVSVQKTLFNYFKGKKKGTQIDVEELQMKVFDANQGSKHLISAEDIKENHIFIQALTFLQALCEGQYTQMQAFLREQTNEDRINPKSFDFLSFLRHATNTYYKVLNRYNLVVGNKVLDLIIELVQGDVRENIAIFLYKTFIYDMCRILTDFNTRFHTLPRGFGMNQFQESFREFKGKVIFLFKTMLENRDGNNKQILTTHLDVLGLLHVFESLVDDFLDKRNIRRQVEKDAKDFMFALANEDFKTTLGDAINIYTIFRYIWEQQEDFDQKMRDLISKTDKSKQDFLSKLIFTIFPELVKSIEIIVVAPGNELRRVWFPVIAVCQYLTDDTKEAFLKNVDRSNSNTKITALLDSTQEFVPQMYAGYEARNTAFGFNVSNLYYGLRFIGNLIALAITILNIATYELDDASNANQDDNYSTTNLGLNITQIVIAGLLIALWWIVLRKRHLSLMWERYVDQNLKTKGPFPPTIKNKLDEGDHQDLEAHECRIIMQLKGANSDDFKEMRRVCKNFKQIALDYRLLKLSFMVKSTSLLWHLIYLGITIGSLFHPLVPIFQILDIAIRSDTLQQIYASISRNARQFIWTLFLLLFINVLYSSIGFFFLNDVFYNDNGPLCQTSFSCFLNVINLGLRSGGGIADVIKYQAFNSDNLGLFFGRVVFDLSFFIFIIILLLNLIFGMIIDAFGDLRDEKTRNEDDQKNVCFICGIGRSQFERYTNFEDHALGEHSIWSYIYYIVYLLDKQKNSKTNMTDIENLVLSKYNVKDLSWIPIGKSLTLEKFSAIERDSQEDKLESLASAVTTIQQNIADLNEEFTDEFVSLRELLTDCKVRKQN